MSNTTKRAIRIEFGPWLKNVRTQKGLSLREAASRIGISYTYLSQLETGSRNVPSIQQLENIASCYNVETEELYRIARVRNVQPPLPIRKTIFSKERLEWAFQAMCKDPEFPMGYTLFQHAALTDAVKFATIDLYRYQTGRILLTEEEYRAGLEIFQLSKDNEKRKIENFPVHPSDLPVRKIRMNSQISIPNPDDTFSEPTKDAI